MTAREMQIEFERLIQLANPQFDLYNKIDSDTIFYFINAAQERYIKQSFVQIDSVTKDSNTHNRLLDVCKALITNISLYDLKENLAYLYAKSFSLPNGTNDKFYVYLNSYSNIVDLRDNKEKIANNELISPSDVDKILVTNVNSPILRNPCIVLNSLENKSSVTIYYDKYTELLGCNITYIRKPLDVNVSAATGTTTTCELDSNVHREIVEMAVDMFIREGTYRLSADKNSNKKDNNNQ